MDDDSNSRLCFVIELSVYCWLTALRIQLAQSGKGLENASSYEEEEEEEEEAGLAQRLFEVGEGRNRGEELNEKEEEEEEEEESASARPQVGVACW